MSTRCNIIIKDEYDVLYFYRHSDGYPSVTGESLKTFLRWVLNGKIRDNASQASGWLILLGAVEYNVLESNSFADKFGKSKLSKKKEDPYAGMYSWKCGAYEPTSCIHGDVEYVYVVDLDRKVIHCCRPDGSRKYDRDKPLDPFHVITKRNINKPIIEDQ